MKISATLAVFLKGADLVAETAYLTLTGKMHYEDNLFALKRFDYYRFDIESNVPESTVSSLKDVLARQSTFYNRNKHGHVLACTWEGGSFQEGPDISALRRRLFDEVTKRKSTEGAADFGGQIFAKKVNLKGNRLFLIESLVEDQDPEGRTSVGGKLQTDLGDLPVSVSNSGTMWWLVLAAENEARAQATAEEILVSDRRDRGLLINPNYQRFDIVSLTEMKSVQNV